ncbi:hypothetical protein [Actinomadura keratinilytica]|uniref:C2H2-type domain-containing protein n=1 Tax=Actinomadura keratinilytica TaxID=547461 RepID=A0ABP7ZH40_9ACTN
MSIAARYWRRMVRAYHLACARDDAAAHGVSVPSGVWVCHVCELPVLKMTTLVRHVRSEHVL